MKINKTLFAILMLLIYQNAKAQKTAVFNGKTYLVYPQMIDAGYHMNSPKLYFSESEAVIQNVKFPPIIGAVPNGDYLIYSLERNYVKIGKGRNSHYDTVKVVYGTFTVLNNEKNGKAIVYNRYDNSQIECAFNYKNDLLDGVFNLAHNNSEPQYYGLSKKKNGFKKNGNLKYSYRPLFSVVNCQEGLITGEVNTFTVVKKDTLLVSKVQVRNGVFEGSYLKNKYEYYKKGIPKLIHIEKGQYIKGQKQGVWAYFGYEYYYDKDGKSLDLKKEIIYKDGLEFESKSYFTVASKVMLYEKTTYAKDSVLFYFPQWKKDKKMYYTQNDYLLNSEDSFVLITRYDNGLFKRGFKANGQVNANFYKDFAYNRTYDTMINYVKIRVKNNFDFKKNKMYTYTDYSVIDTLSFYEGQNYYQSNTLFTEYFDAKGHLQKTTYTNLYNIYFFKDSLVPEIKSEVKNKYCTQKVYYQSALGYTFTNTKFFKGDYKNCEIYYKVKGGKNNGSIIKYIKIPSHYDTIYMIDTLMRNGNYLYKIDEQFSAAYDRLKYHYRSAESRGYYEEEYSEHDYDDEHQSNKVIAKDYLANEIYDFMEPLPIQHKTVLMGRDYFKGKLDLEVKYTDKPKDFKVGVFEYKTNILDVFEKKLSIEIQTERNTNALMGERSSDFIMPAKRKMQMYEKGLLNGRISFSDFYDNYSTEIYFYDNKIEGGFDVTVYKFKDGYRYRKTKFNADFLIESSNCYSGPQHIKITKDKAYLLKGSTMQFLNGVKNGQWLKYESGRISQTYNFQKNAQNGLQLMFRNYGQHAIDYVYNMQNDTVDGAVYSMYPDGMPAAVGHFKHGKPHGFFTMYNEGSDSSKYFSKRIQFSNGFLIGNLLDYRDSNNLKMKVSFSQQDSMIYDGFGREVFQENTDYSYLFRDYYDDYLPEEYENLNTQPEPITGLALLNSIFETASFKKAYYQYYYTSGYLFKQGFKKYDQPIGEWKVYREGNNRMYKTIDFRDSLLFAGTADSLHTYGLVKAYYDNGKLMFTGYATDFEFKYSCESDADMPTENDYYLNFYDTLGKPMITNGSGFITELQANGNKLKEGKIVNNKKEGIWIYYSKFGLPDAIGAYKNGLKTGRWLAGDLGGLNLDEQICFMSDEEFKGWVKAFGGNLNLREEYYDNGELLNSNYVNTIKQ